MTETQAPPITADLPRPMSAHHDSRSSWPRPLVDRIQAGLGLVGMLVMLGLAVAAIATEPGWWKLAGVVGVGAAVLCIALVAMHLRNRIRAAAPDNGDRPSKRSVHADIGVPSERTTRRDA